MFLCDFYCQFILRHPHGENWKTCLFIGSGLADSKMSRRNHYMADNRKSNYFAEWRNELHYTGKELYVHEILIGLVEDQISRSDRNRPNSTTWKIFTKSVAHDTSMPSVLYTLIIKH